MRHSNKFMIIGIILIPFIVFLANALYIVDQRQIALELQFGEVMSVKDEPGLKFKIPFLRDIVLFDNRIQNVGFHSGDTNEVLTADQKTFKLDAFAKYQIVDVVSFYRAVKNDMAFKRRFKSILESTVREVAGTEKFADILCGKREGIMRNIVSSVRRQVKDFGINVIDVRITTVNLPEQSRRAVYNRMTTDRNKEAAEIRAIGMQEAQVIRAETDRERDILIAAAKKKASILRGEGDAEAASIFINIAKKDKEFYTFYRAIEAYRTSMRSDNTYFVVNGENNKMMQMIDKEMRQETKKD